MASARVKVRDVPVKWIAQLGLLRQVDGDLSSKPHADYDRSALWGGAGDKNGVLNSRLPTYTILAQGRFESACHHRGRGHTSRADTASRARPPPHARYGSPPGRPAARIARYAHDASSGQPAPPSGRVNRRTGHAPHPHADGRIHACRHFRRTGSAPAVEPGGRCRRYGVPTGPRWATRGRAGSHLAR